MAKSIEDKERVYKLILDLYTRMSQAIFELNLPSFFLNFNFCRTFNNNEPFEIHPQAVFIHSPKLYLLPILDNFRESVFTLNQAQTLLSEFTPLINPNFFIAHEDNPKLLEENDKSAKKRKFELVEDNLLLLAVKNSRKRDFIEYNNLWLPDRNVFEIRNRYKNLTCGRAPENPIKQHKNKAEGKLSKEEFFLFIKGLQWFGFTGKFELISLYFLPHRSPLFLQKLKVKKPFG